MYAIRGSCVSFSVCAPYLHKLHALLTCTCTLHVPYMYFEGRNIASNAQQTNEGLNLQTFGSFVSKNERRFAYVFINVTLTEIGHRKPPKLDYCFITSTRVVPVSVSIQIRHHWTEK